MDAIIFIISDRSNLILWDISTNQMSVAVGKSFVRNIAKYEEQR